MEDTKTGVRGPIIGKDLLEITLRDGLYRSGQKYPRRVEGKSIFDVLTDTNPESDGISILQPDKIFIWATSMDKGKLMSATYGSKGQLFFNWKWQIAVNDHVSAQNAGIVYIADRKQDLTYWVDLKEKILRKTQGAKEGYRHTDKLSTGYMYIGEISDIVKQFTSNGFVIREE